jgi:hypothetical protein
LFFFCFFFFFFFPLFTSARAQLIPCRRCKVRAKGSRSSCGAYFSAFLALHCRACTFCTAVASALVSGCVLCTNNRSLISRSLPPLTSSPFLLLLSFHFSFITHACIVRFLHRFSSSLVPFSLFFFSFRSLTLALSSVQIRPLCSRAFLVRFSLGTLMRFSFQTRVAMTSIALWPRLRRMISPASWA